MSIQQTLGELTTRHPSAAKVFYTHGLDYCCGGKQTLEDACREKDLSPDEVLAEISREDGESQPGLRWETRPLPELIDYILTRYHASLREELPRLINLAAKVEEVHCAKPDCPTGLKNHLEAIAEAVESHLAKEEQVLFPLIASGRTQVAFNPIQVMKLEHEEHGANLRKTREITHDFLLPNDACATWRELYRSLERLEKDLMDHIHLENNILFPRATEGR
jgi:regulator of cell morphogenesis and NO signaling